MSTTPFQWSKKLDNGEIYVCQADTAEELGLAIEEIKTKFLDFPQPQYVASPTVSTSIENPAPGMVCNVCGGKAEIKEGTSKAGNAYKIFRCITNPELKDKGGDSHFIR